MRLLLAALFVLFPACGGAPSAEGPTEAPIVATFSIVARDPQTGDLGVAVQSRFFGVGAVVPYAEADVGAIATQALAEPTYGPDGLALLDHGASAEEALRALTEADTGRERRQLGLVDARGRAAAFTGGGTMAWAGHVVGDGYCCQGNILAGEAVVHQMARAYEATQGDFPERLVAALAAGQAAGGDKRGRQSAALLVVRREGGYRGRNDRWIDVRVDDHPKPIEELGRLLALRRKSLPPAPVPALVEGLEREDGRTSDVGGAQSARSAWMQLREPKTGNFTYVGTRIEGERSTIYYLLRGESGLQRQTLLRGASGWTRAP
jgi:uncharacterized Ntn-hydrolase superfamily protein